MLIGVAGMDTGVTVSLVLGELVNSLPSILAVMWGESNDGLE